MSLQKKLKLMHGAAIFAILSTLPTYQTAWAQDAEDDSDVERLAELIPDEEIGDEIIVTGSRIRRRSIEQLFPTTTFGEEVLTDRGHTNIADALQEIPGFGVGFSSAGAQGSTTVGQSFVNFLSLGTARTLVLVDGKRYVNSATPVLGGASGLQVDFNSIPSALISRVDTIGVGGAPIYGADAIAGTINVIMKDDFEGLDVSAQYGISDRSDLQEYQLQLVGGANFADDRGNVTMSVEYKNQDGLTQLDRPDIYDPENSYFFSEFFDGNQANGFEDQRGIYNNRLINIFTNGGVASPGAVFIGSIGLGGFPNDGLLQFNSSGELVPFTAGATIPGQSLFFAQGGDGSNLFQETGSLQTPSDRIVASAQARYDIRDNISANASMVFANTNARQDVRQGGFQSFAFTGDTAPVRISVNHPLLTDQARTTLLNNGIDPVDGTFFVNRLNNDIIDPTFLNETMLWRFSGGLEGRFEIGDRDFFWDVSFTHGETDLEAEGDFINDGSFINALDVTRITQTDIDEAGGLDNINAISGIMVGLGDPVCQSVLDVAAGRQTGASGSGITDNNLPFIQGCAPLDIFGFGRASPEALDFVTGPSLRVTDTTSEQIVANLTGDLFDLPAGPLGFNIGFEHRLEKGQFVPSLGDQIALGRSTASPDNGGGFKTDEFYGELSLPVVSPDMKIPLVHSLQLEGAYRTINVSTLDNNTKAFTVGGQYSPIQDIMFRGNYTESTRLPSIAELFSPQTGTFSSAADPCDSRNVTQGNNPAQRQANCAADGIDTSTFISNVVNATAMGATGGNPNLVPEESIAWTVGTSISPRFIPNFNIQVDYMNIEVPDAISRVTLTQVLNACYDSGNFPNNSNCQNFTRDGGGQIVDFLTGQANAGLFDTEFLQIQASYNYELADALDLFNGLFSDGNNVKQKDQGSLSHRLSIFSPLDRNFAVGDEDPRLNNIRGGYTDPNVSANFSTNYTKGNLRVFWGVLWQDNALLTANLTNSDEFFDFDAPINPTPGQNGLDADGRLPSSQAITHGDGSQFIHNASISYDVSDAMEGVPPSTVLQFTVSNVFDRSPSRLDKAARHFGSTAFGFQQVFGRTYKIQLRTRF